MGADVSEPLFRGWIGVALARAGKFDEARREADAGRAAALRSGEADLCHATYARALVDLLDPHSAPGDGERWLESARIEARALGNRESELRASASLARIWHAQGKAGERRELLASLVPSFSEGLDARPIKEANALLMEIA
jgi:hypothetical protein